MRLDFQVLAKVCGPEVLDQGFVTFVTTKWDEVTESRGLARQEEVEEAMRMSLGTKEACFAARLRTAEDAQRLVEATVSRVCRDCGDGRLRLQIENELAKPGVRWMGTTAGSCLLSATQPQSRMKRLTAPPQKEETPNHPAKAFAPARSPAHVAPTEAESSQETHTSTLQIYYTAMQGFLKSISLSHFTKRPSHQHERVFVDSNEILIDTQEGDYVIM